MVVLVKYVKLIIKVVFIIIIILLLVILGINFYVKLSSKGDIVNNPDEGT